MTAPLFDPDQRRTAARIAQHSPHWVVLWGTHTRLYWAFPRFRAPPGTIITAPGTAELTTRMQHIELAARAQMPRLLADLVTEAPIRLQRRLYEAFDLQLLYNKHMHQATIWVTITPTTPGTLAAIINDSDDGHPAASNPPVGPATGTTHPEFSDPLPAPMCPEYSVISVEAASRAPIAGLGAGLVGYGA